VFLPALICVTRRTLKRAFAKLRKRSTSFCSDLTLRWSPSFDALKIRRLRLLTDLWTLRQSMAFQSVLGRPSVPFAEQLAAART
jgi:hypothetical protein